MVALTEKTKRPRTLRAAAQGRWWSMIYRCTNPADKSYKSYGGRGISVCDRWKSFENYYADTGDRPSDGMTLDRIRNDGNYEPGNVRWASWTTQARNRSNNIVLTAFGESKCVAEWITDPRCSICAKTLESRIKAGWPAEDAIKLAPITEVGDRTPINGRVPHKTTAAPGYIIWNTKAETFITTRMARGDSRAEAVAAMLDELSLRRSSKPATEVV